VILVDTPIWSLALRRRRLALGTADRVHLEEWERLITEGTAALFGPIRQELLSGVRGRPAWDRLRKALRPFPDLPTSTEDFERAAENFNRCRERGVTGSAVDLLICAVSMRHRMPVYTTDVDFRRYAKILHVELHTPAA
jgi:predicted nucleic acid-binding protein